MPASDSRLEVPSTPLPPLYMLKKKKTQVTGVDMISPENHTRHIRTRTARFDVRRGPYTPKNLAYFVNDNFR